MPHEQKCRDCKGEPDESRATIVHDLQCPVLRGIKRARAGDRTYFESHPGARSRLREISWGECQELAALTGVQYPSGAQVVVEQVERGVRVLHYFKGRRSA